MIGLFDSCHLSNFFYIICIFFIKEMRKYALIIFLFNKILTESVHNWGMNNQVDLITDMSETCVDDLHTDVYLPFGMGVSDANVIIVSDNDLYPNCIITFHTVGKGIYLIVVIEFPDHTEGQRNACQDDGSTVVIEDDMENINIDVCNEINQMQFGYYTTASYSMLCNSSNISVIITSKSLFETLKITVTSARKLTQYEKCDIYSEVPCLISNASVCISRELQCDENINCGSPTLNDEDVRICDETRYNRLWLVVLCGTIMVMIIVSFLIHLLRTCLPSVPDSFFIFNEDEDNKLILSTKYVAPPETLRQTSLRQNMPAAQSSSFKFKSIPINEKLSLPLLAAGTTPGKQVSLENKEKASLPSSDMEVELESHLYKSDIKRQVDDLIENLPVKAEEDVPPKLSLKKPRFEEENFLKIMDRIDLPAQLPQHQQKIKKQSFDDPMSSKHPLSSPQKDKKDRSPTFSVQEKHRRRTSKD